AENQATSRRAWFHSAELNINTLPKPVRLKKTPHNTCNVQIAMFMVERGCRIVLLSDADCRFMSCAAAADMCVLLLCRFGCDLPPHIAVLKQLGSVGPYHACCKRRGCSHPSDIHRGSNRPQIPIDHKGRPLAQLHRVG